MSRDKIIYDVRDETIKITRRQFEHIVSTLDEVHDELVRVGMSVDASLVASVLQVLLKSANNNTQQPAVKLKMMRRAKEGDV